ncbi:nucleolar transcription factor 1-like isoform X2 [Pagrus major]|uniref:nucleolar transcription factor 1-like isoform X2 n=1 Tax=Pagrus major TaxID=143350 RepID=UPI003CC8B8C8
MSGSSSEPGESDESTDLDESTDWTKVNLQKLLTAMKTSYPDEYRSDAYITGLKAMDWEKVAFLPFSPEACQEKWGEILQKMRRMRTLAELIDEAEEAIANPVLNKKSHPDFPKKPRPPTAIFYEENRAKFKEQHPKMTSRELFKLMTEAYRLLPDEEKARYVEKYHLASGEHKRKTKAFRKRHPVLVKQEKSTPRKRKRVSAVTPHGEQPQAAEGLPPKPPSNGYSLFCREQLPSMVGLSNRTYMSVWAQRWKGLTKREKDEYSIRHAELQKQYTKELNEYLMTFNEEEQKKILNEHGIKAPKVIKRERQVIKRLPGEPKMPSRSGNVIFCQDQMQLMREKFPNARERFRRVNQMWKELSNQEKLRYKDKVNEKLIKYTKKLQKWLKTLTAEEQHDYWRSNPSKRQYLNPKQLRRRTLERKETVQIVQIVHRPSDSEDEEMEDSDCDEPENNLKEVEEEEEEEEDDDEEDVAMFDVY